MRNWEWSWYTVRERLRCFTQSLWWKKDDQREFQVHRRYHQNQNRSSGTLHIRRLKFLYDLETSLFNEIMKKLITSSIYDIASESLYVVGRTKVNLIDVLLGFVTLWVSSLSIRSGCSPSSYVSLPIFSMLFAYTYIYSCLSSEFSFTVPATKDHMLMDAQDRLTVRSCFIRFLIAYFYLVLERRARSLFAT